MEQCVCVKQNEQQHQETCEAVDVHGYDPRAAHGTDTLTARSMRMSGLQTPQKLTLPARVGKWKSCPLITRGAMDRRDTKIEKAKGRHFPG